MEILFFLQNKLSVIARYVPCTLDENDNHLQKNQEQEKRQKEHTLYLLAFNFDICLLRNKQYMTGTS